MPAPLGSTVNRLTTSIFTVGIGVSVLVGLAKMVRDVQRWREHASRDRPPWERGAV